MTLIEIMAAVMVGALVCAAAIFTLVFSLRSYQALTNYQSMNARSRAALDYLSTDIRQANGCTTNATFSASSFTLIGTNPVSLLPCTIRYSYNSTNTTLTRTYIESTNTQTKVLLTNLTSFAFSYFIRNPITAQFGVFTNDSGRADLCKLIQVDWSCVRTNYGSPVDSQSGESARIVIRKE